MVGSDVPSPAGFLQGSTVPVPRAKMEFRFNEGFHRLLGLCLLVNSCGLKTFFPDSHKYVQLLIMPILHSERASYQVLQPTASGAFEDVLARNLTFITMGVPIDTYTAEILEREKPSCLSQTPLVPTFYFLGSSPKTFRPRPSESSMSLFLPPAS
jgi:hypothetical protein